MRIQAPAKVNLVLRILGRRADGFHEIETLMAPLTLCDELEITVGPGEGIALHCDDPTIPNDGRNLAHRAVQAFAAASGLRFQALVSLKKRIPHGAGLAGGSSDAAAVLVALNHLLGTGWEAGRLEEIAATLGSDIPFFIQARNAWCRGRGEILEHGAEVPAMDLLLVKPPFAVPTPWAYQTWAAMHPPPAEPVRWEGWDLSNDLERPVFSKFLLLPVIKTWLNAQPEVSAAMMSGSGSTIFAVLKSPAGDLPERVRREFGESLWTSVCRTADPDFALRRISD